MLKKWFTGRELQKRWNINNADLGTMIMGEEIVAYAPETLDRFNLENEKILNNYREAIIEAMREENPECELPQTIYRRAGEMLFKVSEIEEYEKISDPFQKFSTAPQSTQRIEPPPAPGHPKPNFITQKDKVWHIGYAGQTATIPHLNGFLYIEYLLKNPWKAHSCIYLYHATNPSDTVPMELDQALEEGLSVKTKVKIVNKETPVTRKALMDKYRELDNDYENAVSDLEREQIEKERTGILESLTSEKKLSDPLNQKAQANVKRRIKHAIEEIENAGMTSLAAHLRDKIKPDGNYGYIYNGSSWQPS